MAVIGRALDIGFSGCAFIVGQRDAFFRYLDRPRYLDGIVPRFFEIPERPFLRFRVAGR